MASSLVDARKQLAAYVDSIEATVLSAYGVVGRGQRADPPVFGAPTLKSDKSARRASIAAPSGGTQLQQVVEWRRLQQENAELLYLVALANESLSQVSPTTSGQDGTLREAVAEGATASHHNGPLSLRLQSCRLEEASHGGVSRSDDAKPKDVGAAQQPASRGLPSHLDAVCKLMSQTFEQARRHATGMPPTATMDDDDRERQATLPPHRRAVASAMSRLTDYVLSPVLALNVEATSTRGTQTDAKNEPSGLGRLFVPKRVGPLTSSLEAALQGAEWIPDAIAAALLPFRVAYTVPTLLSSGPVERRLNNVERLQRLVLYHRGADLNLVDVGVVDAAAMGGAHKRRAVSHHETLAGPEAIALLERFLLTERRPKDFREGVAPASSKYYHEEDPLLAAHPCVYLPVTALVPPQGEGTATSARMHHAWVLVCNRASYLLVDTQDTPQQLREDALVYAHLEGADEVHRKLAKLWRKRKAQRESENEQLRHDTLLLQIIDWRSHLVSVDLSQTGAAFQHRSVKDTHPTLLNALPCPRIDRLMACYAPSYAKIDAAEMGQQLYRSLVLQSSYISDPRQDKVTSSRHAVVFLHETDRNEAASLLWATLHASRRNGDLFAPVRGVGPLLPDTTAPSGIAATSRVGANDPVTVAIADPAQRADAIASSSPMVRYAEPVASSTHADWYPMHHLLAERELALCRAAHVHPHTLCLLKHKLFLRPERAWFSLMDVAVTLMAATEAEHVCLATAERVLDLYLSGEQQLCEAVEIMVRLPAS